MMIYVDTNLYMFQPVAVNFISCDVKCITYCLPLCAGPNPASFILLDSLPVVGEVIS